MFKICSFYCGSDIFVIGAEFPNLVDEYFSSLSNLTFEVCDTGVLNKI